MKTLIHNLTPLAFLGVGVYLLLQGRTTAGGLLAFASVLMVRM